VDGRSTIDIADRVSQLLLDDYLSAEMGAAGRAWVLQCWRWDHQAQQLQTSLTQA